MRKLILLILLTISILFFSACSQKSTKKTSSENFNNQYSSLTKYKQKNIEGRYHIRDVNIAKYSPLSAYIIQVKGLGPQEYYKLAIELQYFGRNWIFFKNALIKGSNGENFDFNVSTTEHTSSLDIDGDIKEYVSILLNKNEAIKLLELLNSHIVNVELYGSKDKKYILDQKSQSAIQNLIKYYLKVS